MLRWATVCDTGSCVHRVIPATSFLLLEKGVNQARHVLPFSPLLWWTPRVCRRKCFLLIVIFSFIFILLLSLLLVLLDLWVTLSLTSLSLPL